MSLTRMLDDRSSPLSRFLAERLPDLPAWRAAYRDRLPQAAPARPDWTGQPGPVPYSTIGHAIDFRLRIALSPAAAEECFETGTCRHTTDAFVLDGLTAVVDREPVQHLLAHDVVFGLPPTSAAISAGRRHVGAAAVHLLTGAARLARQASAWQAPGLLLPAEVEDRLCRAVYVAAWLEESARTGRIFPGSALDAIVALSASATPDDVPASAERLLAMVPPAVVEDLIGMLGRAAAAGDWEQLRMGQGIVTGPVFAGSHLVGGADADLICDGLLVDIKATIDPRRAKPQDLYQLLGYALLDTGDEHRLDRIGIFLARHGQLISWPLPEVLELLGGPLGAPAAALPVLRADLRTALEDARAQRRQRDAAPFDDDLAG